MVRESRFAFMPIRSLARAAALGLAGVVLAVGDLINDEYEEAAWNLRMKRLSLDELSTFAGPHRPQPYIMVMFHEPTCPICKTALPKMLKAADKLEKNGVDIAIGHVECSSSVASKAKERFGLPGFPSVLLWRAPAVREGEDRGSPEDLIGKNLQVSSDKESVVKASRAAKMNEAKDGKRLQTLGLTGRVVAVDTVADLTAQLDVPNVGRTWLPMEVLHKENGDPLPYQRLEAPLICDAARIGGWETENLVAFAERLTRPAVTPIASASQLARESRLEMAPPLVFCGKTLSPVFTEVATVLQGTTRAFYAESESACPVEGELPRVMIYSPAEQQWGQGRPKAAVVAAGAEVLTDAATFQAWVTSHRFPGMISIGYKNFYNFADSGRSALLVALDTRDKPGAVHAEHRLMALGGAKDTGSDVVEYTAQVEGDYYLGVVDSSLEGLTAFGAYPAQPPHIIIMEGKAAWVEDAMKLTLHGLPGDLDNVPSLWRMRHGVMGKFIWGLREVKRSYELYDTWADDAAGMAGRAGLAGFALFVSLSPLAPCWTLLRGIFKAAFIDQPGDIKED